MSKEMVIVLSIRNLKEMISVIPPANGEASTTTFKIYVDKEDPSLAHLGYDDLCRRMRSKCQ